MKLNKRYILSKYERIFSKIEKLEHSHHLARVDEILEPCHDDLPSDKRYNERIRRLASKALKLLFKLISLENPDSTCLPNNSHKHLCLKEIGFKETIGSNAQYIELGEMFFLFESNSENSPIHIQNTKETFIWDSMDLLSKYNIELETLAKKIHNYCPITVEGCKRPMSLSSFCDYKEMRELLYSDSSKDCNQFQPIPISPTPDSSPLDVPISISLPSLLKSPPDSLQSISHTTVTSFSSEAASEFTPPHSAYDLILSFLLTQLAIIKDDLKIPHFSSFLPPQTNVIVSLSVQPRPQKTIVTKEDKTAHIPPAPNSPIPLPPPSIKPLPNIYIILFPISVLLLVLELVFKKQTSEAYFFHFLLLSINFEICLSVQLENCDYSWWQRGWSHIWRQIFFWIAHSIIAHREILYVVYNYIREFSVGHTCQISYLIHFLWLMLDLLIYILIVFLLFFPAKYKLYLNFIQALRPLFHKL